MAQPVLWQLAMGQNDPFSSYAEGYEANQKRQTILEQLAGQREDRQFNRETNARDFQFRKTESDRNQSNWQQQFLQTQKNAGASQSIAMAQLKLAQDQFQRGEVPAGFERDPSDPTRLRPRQGGPADPTTIRNNTLAQREPVAPQYKEIDGPNGKVLVRISPDGTITAPDIPGLSNAAPPNPYAPRGKLTDEQAKAGLYATRMAAANDIIGPLEKINQGMGGWLEGTVTNAAPIATNSMQSADRQRFIQAQRDFINAVLRRESGAVIAEPEFQNARQQYFPQPGDTPEQLQQKAANRRIAIEGIMSAAGPQYQPPQNYRQPNAPRPQQTQQQAPVFAVNPQTGQRIQFQNGQWVPVQ